MKMITLIPLVEAQASKYVCLIGELLGWPDDCPEEYFNWPSFIDCPRLFEVLEAAHQFRDSCRPISVSINTYPIAPALKILDAILIHIFPIPRWEGRFEFELTDIAKTAWFAGQQVYAERIGL